jgi:hypothetical protein
MRPITNSEPDRKPDPDVLLGQFNRLMQELLRGNMSRNCFRPWEIDLLLDIEGCNLSHAKRREVLRRYQKAVQRTVEKGAPSLLKMSEYLTQSRRRTPRRDGRRLPPEVFSAATVAD